MQQCSVTCGRPLLAALAACAHVGADTLLEMDRSGGLRAHVDDGGGAQLVARVDAQWPAAAAADARVVVPSDALAGAARL